MCFFSVSLPSHLTPSLHLDCLPWPSPPTSPGPVPLPQSPRELAAGPPGEAASSADCRLTGVPPLTRAWLPGWAEASE